MLSHFNRLYKLTQIHTFFVFFFILTPAIPSSRLRLSLLESKQCLFLKLGGLFFLLSFFRYLIKKLLQFFFPVCYQYVVIILLWFYPLIVNLGYADRVIYNISERQRRVSIPVWFVRFTYAQITLGKGMKPTPPLRYVPNSRTCIWKNLCYSPK